MNKQNRWDWIQVFAIVSMPINMKNEKSIEEKYFGNSMNSVYHTFHYDIFQMHSKVSFREI